MLGAKVFLGDRVLDLKAYRQGKDLKSQQLQESKKRLILHNIPKDLRKNGPDFEMEFKKFGEVNKFFLMTSDKKHEGETVLVGHVIYKNEKSV